MKYSLSAIHCAFCMLFLSITFSAESQTQQHTKPTLQYCISIPGINNKAKMTPIESWNTGFNVNVDDSSLALYYFDFVMYCNEYDNAIKKAMVSRKTFDSISIYLIKKVGSNEYTVLKIVYKNVRFKSYQVGGSSNNNVYPVVSIGFEYDEAEDNFYGENGDNGGGPINSSVIKGKAAIISEE